MHLVMAYSEKPLLKFHDIKHHAFCGLPSKLRPSAPCLENEALYLASNNWCRFQFNYDLYKQLTII